MRRIFSWIFPSEFFEMLQYFRAFALGMVYLVVLLLQLFTYEKFPDIVFGFGIPGGEVMSHILAIILPLAGLMALPYLMSMRTNVTIRLVSRYSTIAMPLLWLLVGLWINLSTSASHANTGLFGATVVTPVSWGVVVFSAFLLLTAVLVVRELPVRSR